MSKPFSLKPLLDLAQLKNESATRELGHLNKRQHEAQEKLDVLLQYRKDYQNRLQESTRNGMSPADLRNFQQFINKLDEAITQQIKAVDQSKVSVQAGRTEFNTAQRKLKSFSTLQDRHIEEQIKVEAKLEQHALDEHTGKFAARRIMKT